jgi:putative ABC transport system permease protein
MKNPVISLTHLNRHFGRQQVLHDVDVDFPATGLIGLVGASGSGKSTLLNIMSGLDSHYEGSAKVYGREWKKMSEAERSSFRLKHIGYVFQSFNLLELETVLSNVLVPLDALSNASTRLKKRKAFDYLSFVGLKGKAQQRLSHLSGGEKQRVCFARALVSDPDILLCDEPTGALDEKNAILIFELLKAIAKTKLVIVVSHDRKLVEHYAAFILSISDGHLEGEALKKAPVSLAPPSSVELGTKQT